LELAVARRRGLSSSAEKTSSAVTYFALRSRLIAAAAGGCALALALPAFAATVGAIPADPLVGSWRANLAASRFATGFPRLRTLAMTYVSEPQRRIACAAVSVTADGRRTTARFAARYDGRSYPVTGMRGASFVTLRRDGRDVIAVFGRRTQAMFAYRMVPSTDGRHLTVRSIHPRTGQLLFTTVQYDLLP
jgi:hypothetical protein